MPREISNFKTSPIKAKKRFFEIKAFEKYFNDASDGLEMKFDHRFPVIVFGR